MFGRDAREAAVIEMWTRRAELLVGMPLMMAVRHAHPALAALETQIPEVAQSNLQTAERALVLFDRQLAEHRFIAGDRITMADIVVAAGMDFARMVRFAVPEPLTHVARWRAEMMARDAAKAGV